MKAQLEAPKRAQRRTSSGVLVADGYGIRIAIERGQLIINDGAGRNRQEHRIPKVGHGIRRLIIIGHTGTISLEAIRWLDRVGIHLAHIDNDGKPLAATAHEAVGNARLRRAQALAATTHVGIEISRYLLDHKLAGQANNARRLLGDPATADLIDSYRERLASIEATATMLEIESAAANDYFALWADRVSYRWANNDASRLPEHWKRFTTRRSLLARNHNRRATDPINATLNYLYALGELECRRACLVLGLDPGLGFLHNDVPARDSLALDLIEAIRPDVDAYVLQLAQTRIFTRADFHETDDGHTRALPPLTHSFAETLPRWEAAIAPIAERVAHLLADSSPYPVPKRSPLTGAIRSATSLENSAPRRRTERAKSAERTAPRRRPQCLDCGAYLTGTALKYCEACLPARRADQRKRAVADSAALVAEPQALAARNRSVSIGKKLATERTMADLGLTNDDWNRISEGVRRLPLKEIMSLTGLAISQASRIRSGKQRPHPQHWVRLGAATQSLSNR